MFRDKTPRPAPASPPRPFMNAVKVRKSFTCEGRLISAGTLLSLDDQLVRELRADYPDHFEPI